MNICNFGRNVCFQSRQVLEPASEAELLELLDGCGAESIRAIGSKHAWSPLIESKAAVVSLSRLNSITLRTEPDGSVRATVGGGCQIKEILTELNRHGLTLPSVGLITEQTIAGAISTGTHGSGRESLSHFIDAVRIAHFHPETGRAEIVTVDAGDSLRASRCSLGCLGLIVSVDFRCRPQYDVAEHWTSCTSIGDILAQTVNSPLQQFYLIPHRWDWLAQHRTPLPESRPRSWSACLYRWYFHLTFDVGMHVAIKVCAAWLHSPRLTRLLCRVLPSFVVRGWTVVDRSDLQLVMEHELFRHVETELFVRESRVAEAADFVIATLKVADGADPAACLPWRDRLETEGLWDRLERLRGRFTHHYPICFRRVLPDDTLISATAGADEAWYSISLVTYVEPRDRFFETAEFLSLGLMLLFGARLHWGKHVPEGCLDRQSAAAGMPRFRQVLRQFDPGGRFQNAFTRRVTSANVTEPGRVPQSGTGASSSG
jgi:FAD/FMN-containing dehydrogenase